MTQAPDDRPDRPQVRSGAAGASAAAEDPPVDPSGISVAALGVWLLVQLLALTLSAARVALWHRAPQPVEQFAVEQVLVVQLACAAVLLPWLMPNLATGLCVILVSAPFVKLAALLAEAPLGRVAAAWACAALWLGAGMMLSLALRPWPRGSLLAVALTGVLTLGSPILRYLYLEFSHFPPPTFRTWPAVDPIHGTLSQLSGEPGDAAPWLVAAGAMALSLAGWAVSRRLRQTTSYPHP